MQQKRKRAIESTDDASKRRAKTDSQHGADSNWKRLQQTFKPSKASALRPRAPLTRVLAIDCEMVGVGPKGADSRLARYNPFFREVV